MKIIEIKGWIAGDGSIILPPGVLETMCITTGNPVHLVYLSHHPVKQINSYGEFFLTKEGIDHVSEPLEALKSAKLPVPHALLEAVGHWTMIWIFAVKTALSPSAAPIRWCSYHLDF